MDKRGRKSIKININLSNRWLYTLIIIGILIAIGVGVYAATYSSSGAGHPYTEISTCGDGQILKMSGGAWTCATPIQDPPGLWTCNLRTGPSTIRSSSVSCVGSEKVITGGCDYGASYPYAYASHPTSNGWNCLCPMCSGLMTAYAYCCL